MLWNISNVFLDSKYAFLMHNILSKYLEHILGTKNEALLKFEKSFFQIVCCGKCTSTYISVLLCPHVWVYIKKSVKDMDLILFGACKTSWGPPLSCLWFFYMTFTFFSRDIWISKILHLVGCQKIGKIFSSFGVWFS